VFPCQSPATPIFPIAFIIHHRDHGRLRGRDRSTPGF
jgi:hypothetical protein